MNIDTATAEQLLQIPLDEPERLFSRGQYHQEYLRLVKRWHPDRSTHKDTVKVFVHVTSLRQRAEEKAKAGTWTPPGIFLVKDVTGETRSLRYVRKHVFELGELLIGRDFVAYCIKHEYKKLGANGVHRIASIPYPDNRLRAKTEFLLPKVMRQFSHRNYQVVALSRMPDTILLTDLLRHIGTLPAPHTAWVISSLLSTLSFFQLVGICHNGLAPDTVFINPKLHTVHLTGGWWYAALQGEKITHLPPFTRALASPTLIASKQADQRLDIESVKAIARVCLGDPSGASIGSRPDIPKRMADFLRLPSRSAGISEYEQWQKVLVATWGEKRRFTQLLVKERDVYPQT